MLGQPERALPLLLEAYGTLMGWAASPCAAPEGVDLDRARQEVASSLAHALLHAGDAPSARAVMLQVVRGAARPEHHELYRAILDHERAAVEAQPSPPRARQVSRRARKRRRHTKDG